MCVSQRHYCCNFKNQIRTKNIFSDSSGRVYEPRLGQDHFEEGKLKRNKFTHNTVFKMKRT